MNEHPENIFDLNERLYPGQSNRRVEEDHRAVYDFASAYASGKKVLDIACGVGYGSEILRQAGADVVGLDNSAEAINSAKADYPNIRFVLGDAISTGLLSGSFDLIVSISTWHHLDDYEGFITEMARLLRPGGTFIVSVPNAKVIYLNPFHRDFMTKFYRVDLTKKKAERLLNPEFASVTWFGQRFVKRKYANVFSRVILTLLSAVSPWIKNKAHKAFSLADGPEVKPLIHENARYIIAVCKK